MQSPMFSTGPGLEAGNSSLADWVIQTCMEIMPLRLMESTENQIVRALESLPNPTNIYEAS